MLNFQTTLKKSLAKLQNVWGTFRSHRLAAVAKPTICYLFPSPSSKSYTQALKHIECWNLLSSSRSLCIHVKLPSLGLTWCYCVFHHSLPNSSAISYNQIPLVIIYWKIFHHKSLLFAKRALQPDFVKVSHLVVILTLNKKSVLHKKSPGLFIPKTAKRGKMKSVSNFDGPRADKKCKWKSLKFQKWVRQRRFRPYWLFQFFYYGLGFHCKLRFHAEIIQNKSGHAITTDFVSWLENLKKPLLFSSSTLYFSEKQQTQLKQLGRARASIWRLGMFFFQFSKF